MYRQMSLQANESTAKTENYWDITVIDEYKTNKQHSTSPQGASDSTKENILLKFIDML